MTEKPSLRNAPPLVNILIVTWNRKDDCLKSVESAFAQTWPNTEIVVVDNASPDGTGEAVRERFPGARLIRSHVNLGCPSGRNLGFANCLGKYIYSLDDDGWLAPDAVALLVEQMEAAPAMAVAMSQIHLVENGTVVDKLPQGVTVPAHIYAFSGGCSMIRHEALTRCGMYPDDFFRQGEETDLSLRLMDAGYEIAVFPDSIMYHAPSPSGRSPKAFRYYMIRNMMKTCLRLWPMPDMAWRVAGNVLRAFKYAAIYRSPVFLAKLLGCFARDLATLKGRRQPVGRAVVRRYLELQYNPRADDVSFEKNLNDGP